MGGPFFLGVHIVGIVTPWCFNLLCSLYFLGLHLHLHLHLYV